MISFIYVCLLLVGFEAGAHVAQAAHCTLFSKGWNYSSVPLLVYVMLGTEPMAPCTLGRHALDQPSHVSELHLQLDFFLFFSQNLGLNLAVVFFHNVNNDRALRIFVVIFPAQPFGSLIPHSWEQPANGLSVGQVATIPSDLLCGEEAAPGSVSSEAPLLRE